MLREQFNDSSQPGSLNPIRAQRTDLIHHPTGKTKLVVHGPHAVNVRGMNEHRAHGQEIAEKSRDIHACAGISRFSGLWIQVVVQRNQRSTRKGGLTLSTHRISVTPDLQLEIRAKDYHYTSEGGNAVIIVLEDEDGFHWLKLLFLRKWSRKNDHSSLLVSQSQ